MTDSTSTDPISASAGLEGADGSAVPPAVDSGRVQSLPMLSACELELFSHYIIHTSRVIPHGKEDMFPLQIGMPNLAFTNPAVMHSILALAASCKCHDMMGSWATSPAKLEEICDLLRLADRHHQTSLDQLQNDIKER
ncbi:hypothetical protein MY5147_004928 [Beauveria neobassiana]